MYKASGDTSKARSLSGKTIQLGFTTMQEIAACEANGTGWYLHTWSQRELIRTLIVLLGKSTDTQSIFGWGNSGNTSPGQALPTGTLNTSGRFHGVQTLAHQIKVFHLEGFWGDAWDKTAGLLCNKGQVYVKMTPMEGGYRVTDTQGYKDINLMLPEAYNQYFRSASCTEHGLIPIDTNGSQSTYFADALYTKNTEFTYLYAGGGFLFGAPANGAFTFSTNSAPGEIGIDGGFGLSLIQPAHT